MNKKELIERIEGLKNLFGNKAEYIEIDAAIELISELDEPEKVKVPQFVAEWIEKCKEKEKSLLNSLLYTPEGVNSWVSNSENQETFALAWIFGYEVEKEKEKRYVVKIIGITNYNSYLNYHKGENKWTIESRVEIDAIRTKHTRKELEDAGFGEVFNSPLFEIEEVTE
jgi:hypothetical protein|nr:MAG TPA: Protein of unknown function (DUF1642) [Caudoviricetes sp.]